MTEKVNTLEDLAQKIELETDLNKVKIDNETYDDVLENQKSKLKQWLYSMLHTGNLNNQVKQSSKTFNDLKMKRMLRYDYYVDSLNCLIEFDGEQHYYKIDYFNDTDEKFRLRQMKDHFNITGIELDVLTQ